MTNPIRVLVVDSDLAGLHATVRSLRTLGYKVTAASDGQMALDLILSVMLFSLIISDGEMPRMSGLELLKKVRLDPDPFSLIRNTPFILYSTDKMKFAGDANTLDATFLPKGDHDQPSLEETIKKVLREEV
jgi:two-component system chemotaxis response regulator CheY